MKSSFSSFLGKKKKINKIRWKEANVRLLSKKFQHTATEIQRDFDGIMFQSHMANAALHTRG